MRGFKIHLGAKSEPGGREVGLVQFDSSRSLRRAGGVMDKFVWLPPSTTTSATSLPSSNYHFPKRPSTNNTPTPANSSSKTVSTSFSRIQFRHATANNGKANQVQERFVLVVKVFALIDGSRVGGGVGGMGGMGGEMGYEEIEVGEWKSGKLIVRGRSPKNFNSSSTSSRVKGGKSSVIGSGGGGNRKRNWEETETDSGSEWEDNRGQGRKKSRRGWGDEEYED